MRGSDMSEQSPNKSESQCFEIIVHEDLVKEASVKKIEKHLYQIDRFRLEVLKTVVAPLELYSNGEIGEAVVIQIFQEVITRVKRRINLLEATIPEVVNLEFMLWGSVKDGGTILISHEFDASSKIQAERERLKKKYQDHLSSNLSLSLGGLLIGLEGTLMRIETLGKYPDAESWYPQLARAAPRVDPRVKFHSDNYWPTAYQIKTGKELTWQAAYTFICKEMTGLGLDLRHNNFESFETARKRYQREHGYPDLGNTVP